MYEYSTQILRLIQTNAFTQANNTPSFAQALFQSNQKDSSALPVIETKADLRHTKAFMAMMQKSIASDEAEMRYALQTILSIYSKYILYFSY